MKTKTIKVCDAIHIDISCEQNDLADIKCGGSPILGYDFYISPDEDKKDIENFIKQCIKKYNRPFIGISFNIKKDFPITNLWTKEKIEECIKQNSF